MAYVKQNFKNGDVLTAEQLNHMEEGIVNAENSGGISGTAKTLILNLFEGAAYGNAEMQGTLSALKAEWDASPDDGGTDVAVSSVLLNNSVLTLKENETATLTATVLPSNASNKTVTWSVSPVGYASVSSGKVTAIKVGVCTVTATAGGKSASCTVTVATADEVTLPVPVYDLPASKQFLPENEEYIDTGIKLFENVSAQPTWTILFRANDFGRLTQETGKYMLFHCMTESGSYPGLCLQLANAGSIQLCLFDNRVFYGYFAGSTSGSIVSYIQIKGTQCRVGNDPDNDEWTAIGNYSKNVPFSLILGAFRDADGSIGRYWDGTLQRFTVYDQELTNDQLKAWLNA